MALPAASPRERLQVVQKLLNEVKDVLLPDHAGLRERLDLSLHDLDALSSDLESCLGTGTADASTTAAPCTPSTSAGVPMTPVSWDSSSTLHIPSMTPVISSVYPTPTPTKTSKVEDEAIGSDNAAAKALEAKKQATAAFKAHDFDTALRLCNLAVELEPEEATHLSNRSLAHLRRGSFTEAQADAAAAVALKPTWGRAHYRLGAAHQALENWPSAVRSFAAALDLDPGSEVTQRALEEAQRASQAAAYEAATGQAARQQAAADRAKKLEAEGAARARARQLEAAAQADARSRALAAQLEAARCAEDAAREAKLAQRRAAAEALEAKEAALTGAVQSHVATVRAAAAQASRLLESSGMEGGDATSAVASEAADRGSRSSSCSSINSNSSGSNIHSTINRVSDDGSMRGDVKNGTERPIASQIADTARREALAAQTAAASASAAATTKVATTSPNPFVVANASTTIEPMLSSPGKAEKAADEPTPATTPAWAVAAAQQQGSSSASSSSTSPLLLATSSRGGRFWTAKRKVARGEVLLVEFPLACVVQGQYTQDLCHFCLGRLELGDAPRACGRCQFTRWCSEKCRVAERAAHADECGILETLSSNKISNGTSSSSSTCSGSSGNRSSTGEGKSESTTNDAGLRLCLRLLGATARGGPLVRQKLNDLEAHEEKDSGEGSRSGESTQGNASERGGEGHGNMATDASGTSVVSHTSSSAATSRLDRTSPASSSTASSLSSSSSSTPALDRMVGGLSALSRGRFSSGPRSTVPANEVRHVIGVVRTNGFVVSDLEGRRLGNGLWCLASFFNHACWPNACVSFTQQSSGKGGIGLVLEARALREILPGEPITIGYTELYRPLALRQRTLRASKGFHCSCPRCCAESKLDAAEARQAELAYSSGGGGSTSTAGRAAAAPAAAGDHSISKASVVDEELTTDAATLALWEKAEVAAAPVLAEAGSASSNGAGSGEAAFQRRHQSALLAIVAGLRAADGKSGTNSSTTSGKDSNSSGKGSSSSSSSGDCRNTADEPLIPAHWLRFELHCLASTLLLARPKTDLPPSLVRALLPNASSSSSSSSSSHQDQDHKSPSSPTTMNSLLHHARAAVARAERGGAYHSPLTASSGNARLAAVACRTSAAAPIVVSGRGLQGNNDKHGSGSGLWANPRLALCRRNLGNALMFAAAAATSGSRGALAAEAAVQYGRAGDALEGCWGKQHRDTASLRQLEAWAKGFC